MDEKARFLESLQPATAQIRFCERFDGQSRIWNLERHSHNVFEFLYFLDGGAHIQAEAELQAGLFDLVIYPPGVAHEERLVEGFRNEVVCFWVDLGATPSFGEGLVVGDPTGEIRVLVEALYQEAITRRPLANDMVVLYVQGILTLARRWLEERPRDDQGLVGRCLSFIHEHYTEDFDVETMAHAVAVSPSYLFRSFKKKLGVTPMHYRSSVRIDKSKLLLCQSNRRLDLIAQDLGFTDVKYFSSLFKQLTGLTPGTFRRLNSHHTA